MQAHNFVLYNAMGIVVVSVYVVQKELILVICIWYLTLYFPRYNTYRMYIYPVSRRPRPLCMSRLYVTCGEVRNYEYSIHVSITGADAVALKKRCSAARMSRRAADWKIRCHSEFLHFRVLSSLE